MSNRKIIILWATIRPEVFKETHTCWVNNAAYKGRLITRVAVDTVEQAQLLKNSYDDVVVTNSVRPGVCYPCYCLSSTLRADPDDIVIFASDDFFPPESWDKFLYDQFVLGEKMLLVVNDGIQKTNRVVTIPIMNFRALEAMNYIIYHPAYNHMYSDIELYDTADKLKILKDVRLHNKPIFEHRHYANGKRKRDNVDEVAVGFGAVDRATFFERSKMSIEDLLKV